MFENWTGWKTVKAALFSLITLDAWLMSVNDFGPALVQYAKLAAGLLGAIGVIVTALSGTPMGPTIARGVAKVAAAAFVFVLVPRALVACALFSASSPTADFGACVDDDALHGKTIDDMVHDCGKDVPSVIAQIVDLLKGPRAAELAGKRAVLQVMAMRAELAALPPQDVTTVRQVSP